MDPITLILTALAAKAPAGIGPVNDRAMEAAAESLNFQVRRRLADDAGAGAALDDYARDPETYRGPLTIKLAGSGAADDPLILDAASRVLDLADPEAQAGKYNVSVLGSYGVQIGSYSTQANVFNSPPIQEDTER